ncbi:MAG: RidA family protein [Clostridia bacterium]
MRKIVATDKAPAAIGPYAQANIIGDLVITSGQIPIDPATGNLVEGDIEAQTKQVFENLKAVLEAAGSGLDKIVKTTCFMDNMNDFAKMNEVYASFFSGDYPSRSAVEVAKLPKGALIEIEAIAYL